MVQANGRVVRPRRVWVVGVVVVCVGALAALLLFLPRKGSESLRIGYSPYSVNVPLFVAVERGLLSSRGISCELFPFQSTDQLATALRTGRIDVATALTAESVYAANERDHDSVRPFFFNIFRAARAVDAIVVPRDSKVQSVGDLAGKNVAVLPANMMRVALRSFLSHAGLEPDSVNILSLPPASILVALSSGDADACYVLEPLVTVSQQRMGARVIALGVGARGITDPLPAGFHAVRSQLAEERPDLVSRLTSAYAEGARSAQDRNVAAGVLVKYCGMDAQLAQAVVLPEWSAWDAELQQGLRVQFDALKPILGWGEAAFSETHYVKP